MTVKRIFIVTGDPSGDQHGAAVAQALWEIDPSLLISAVGGNALKSAGVHLLRDQSRMGFVGVSNPLTILTHYFLGRTILQYLETAFHPDAVLLIDYGGFNLWLAGELKKRGYPVHYYIPPQVWASRKNRIHKIKAHVDQVYCILPFEEDLYRRHGIAAQYVGHPLMSQLPPAVDRKAFCQAHGLDPTQKIVALLPGSRSMEIKYLLRPILESLPIIQSEAKRNYHQSVQFILSRASSAPIGLFNQVLNRMMPFLENISLKVVADEGQAMLSVADTAIVASGTATLEAALYQTPLVLVYKGPWVAYQVAKRLIYLPVIGLPNVLTNINQPIVPELHQYDVTPDNIARALLPFLNTQSEPYTKTLSGFQTLREILGSQKAAQGVASHMMQQLLQPGLSAV